MIECSTFMSIYPNINSIMLNFYLLDTYVCNWFSDKCFPVACSTFTSTIPCPEVSEVSYTLHVARYSLSTGGSLSSCCCSVINCLSSSCLSVICVFIASSFACRNIHAQSWENQTRTILPYLLECLPPLK